MADEKFFIDLSAKLINNNVEKILKKIVSKSEDQYKKLSSLIGIAFKNYYKSVLNNHLEVKTILYSRKPVNLYRIYVDLTLDNNGSFVKAKKITDVINISNYLIIT